MMNGMRQYAFIALIVVITAVAWWPSLDAQGNATVDAAFKRALVTWAIARSLNGVLSVAQGTEVAIQPAGIGVNFTPGEILDPINDLVERFSWIMMLAASSLGVQQVLLAMSAWQGLLVALSIAALIAIGAQFYTKNPQLARMSGRLFLFLVLLRFLMPGIAMANQWVYDTFLDSDYQAATKELSIAQEKISDINDAVKSESESSSQDKSALEMARDAVRRIGSSVNIDRHMAQYSAAAEQISVNTIRLVVVFLMQTLVFPLLFLLIVVRFFRRLLTVG